MLDALRIIAGLLLIFFIPGLTVVQALFPRKGELDVEFDPLYRVTLAIGLSIVVTILAGFALNSLGINPQTGMGYFTAPYITLSLVLISMVLFIVGWYRGAYPFLEKLHPALLRLPKLEAESVLPKGKKAVVLQLQTLSKEREDLRRTIKDCERKIKLQSGSMKEHYRRKKSEAQEKLKDIDERLSGLQEKRARELY
jgi:hypothetical protein